MNGLKKYTESQLISILRTGSVAAFNELFDRYGSRIYRFAAGYLKNSCDAEEIVQEVFLRVWKVREEISADRPLDAFIFTIARNGILNMIRKARTQQTYLDYCTLYPDKAVLVDEELDFHELEKLCREAVNQLSPRRREIFRLSRERHLSNAEIAQMLGISPKTVENQMTAALSDLRRNLQRHGFAFFFYLEQSIKFF